MDGESQKCFHVYLHSFHLCLIHAIAAVLECGMLRALESTLLSVATTTCEVKTKSKAEL